MSKTSLRNIKRGEALRLARQAKEQKIFAYISTQRAADPQAWDRRVNFFILANNCAGGQLLPNGWIVDAQGRKLYPVGSCRWQWEEEALAERELGI